MVRTKESRVAEAKAFSPADRAASASTASSSGLVAPTSAQPKLRRPARLPAPLQFPLVVVLSFALSSLAHAFLREWTVGGELGSIARQPEPTSEIALLAGWKILELALAWYGNYDGYDMAALTVLSHGPYLYLLYTFYGISARATGASLGIDLLSGFAPFLLLRRLSGAHSAAPTVPNREIIQDKTIQGFTTLLAGVIYSTTLFIACKLFLPSIFVLYFEGIPSIQPAVDATLLGSVPTETLGLLFGLAARTLIFTPAAAIGPKVEDQQVANFDPGTATLGQTILWNLWGYTSKPKAAIRRTAVAMLVTGVETFLQCRGLNGTESFGAAVYAAVWVIGTMLTGQSLAYVVAV